MARPWMTFFRKLKIFLPLTVFLCAALAHAQKPGAYYWGDSDGNGVIEVPDLITLNTVLGNPGADDGLLYAGHPQSRFRQDLDGNGVMEIPDLILLNSWIPGNFSSKPGNPDRLVLDGATHVNVYGMNPITLGAYALSPVSAGSQVRTGFGVIFTIEPPPATTCPPGEVVLYGYSVAGGATINQWRWPSVYHYTLKPGAPDNGLVQVMFKTGPTCMFGRAIIDVYIPDDGEAGVVPGRFPAQLAASSKFTVGINSAGAPCPQVWAMDVIPGSTTIDDGGAIAMAATCTLTDLTQVDCTDSYCGITTMWGATGNLINDQNPIMPPPPNIFWAPLPNGGHGTVKATYDTWISDTASITIRDQTPPETTIDSGPLAYTHVLFANFEFSCDEPLGCTFQCKLDSAPFSSCESPMNYPGLSEGTHTFQVQAFDVWGNMGQATYTWIIDMSPPFTFIDTKPPNPSYVDSASFTFHCIDDYTPCTFECKLELAGAWGACNSPKDYAGLSQGSHTFYVRATNSYLWQGPIASYPWTVDLNPDTIIDSNPPDPSYADTASFTFHCTKEPCTYQCKMDAGSYGSCTSPKTYSGLSHGSHTFYVYGTDSQGHSDPSAATYTWMVDLTPDTIIDSYPPNPTLSVFADFAFHCTKPTCTYECQMDSGSWSACTSPKSYPDSWTATSTGTNVPSARGAHTAVWTGTEMIIWGGGNGASSYSTGGRYNPVGDYWLATSNTNAPTGRVEHTAVWTGNIMIVWGGWNGLGRFSTGGRYNPATDSWTATTTTNAPSARNQHAAVWADLVMVVWGGDAGASRLNTGAAYNPSHDNWITLNSTGAPVARAGHAAVWTGTNGTNIIIWGGNNGSTYYNSGGRYNLLTGTWTATSLSNAPSARTSHRAVWTGTEMIVWGGMGLSVYNTGGRYNSSTDSWTATSTGTNCPAARYNHSAIWAGTEMVVWGGYDGSSYFNTGGRYNPGTDSWIATTNANAPSGRNYHTAVWTKDAMIVWGGGAGSYTNTGGILGLRRNTHSFQVRATYVGVTDPTPAGYSWSIGDFWTATSTGANVPSARALHSAVWTGSQMIVWGGYDGAGYLNTGGKYAPATDSWTATSTSSGPGARADHTSLWNGTDMIVWGGYDGASYLNSGGKYAPATDSWITTSTSGAPSARGNHTVVWSAFGSVSPRMIVWGGYDGSSYYNTGGLYDPSGNSWAATSTGTNVPSARENHTAIWTGSWMIVWGGYDGAVFLNTGGKYDQQTNSWLTATSTINAPSGREKHSAVWTGTQMIIWGGFDTRMFGFERNDGGRYEPVADSWSYVTGSFPPDMIFHRAIWTGIEMIVWGTSPGPYAFGANYQPSSNIWTSMTYNMPAGRSLFTAVWTGTEMIVWGGNDGTNYLNTGGRYAP